MHQRAYIAASLALGLSGAPALASSGGTFAGKTSDGYRVVVHLAANTVGLGFQSRFRCSDGTTFVARASYKTLKFTGGRFAATLANPDRSIKTKLAGTISPERATGTISRRATFNDAHKLDPRGSLTCTSRASWRALKR